MMNIFKSAEHPAFSNILHKPPFAITILILGLVLTISAWFFSNYYIHQRAEDNFEYRSNEVQNLITRRMGYYEQVVRGGVALFEANEFVSREDWKEYVYTLKLKDNFPGIQGLGFSYNIPPGQIDSLEKAIHANGYEQFEVYPTEDVEEVHSIIYLEPFDWRNQRAFGYNMFSEKVRRQAMIQARNKHATALSGKVTLVQETDEDVQPGFLIYIPVFKNGAAYGIADNLYGYVFSPLRANDLMENVLGGGPEEIEFAIYDGDSTGEENILYRSTENLDNISEKFLSLRKIQIAGHTWTLKFVASTAFISNHYNIQPLIVALAGIIVEIILFYLIWSAYSMNRFYKKAKKDAENNANQLQVALHKRKDAEDALKEKQKMLEASNQDLNTFIYSVSHDIKNPLTAILLHSQLAEEYTTVEEYKQFMALVNRNGEKIKVIIDMMSYVIKEEYKNNTIENLDLQTELDIIIEDFRDVLKDVNATITVNLEVREITYIKGFLHSIISNLIENAIKYRHPGRELVIQIKSTRENDYLVLSVSDNGKGIDLEKNGSRIFKPFQRFARNTSGSGLGLFIIKRMVQKNGGSIQVESKIGEGTTFRCLIKNYQFADNAIPIKSIGH